MPKILMIILLSALAFASGESIAASNAQLVIYGGGRQLADAGELLSKYGPNPTKAQLENAAVEMQAARLVLHPHQKMQLTVLRTTGPGAPKDVTGSSNVMYSSDSPWLVRVSAKGLISVEPEPGFKTSATLNDETRDMVQVSVLYGDKSGLTGYNAIFLKIEK